MKHFFCYAAACAFITHSLCAIYTPTAHNKFLQKHPKHNQQHLALLESSGRRAKKPGQAGIQERPQTYEEWIALYPPRPYPCSKRLADITLATAWLATISYHALSDAEASPIWLFMLYFGLCARRAWEEKSNANKKT